MDVLALLGAVGVAVLALYAANRLERSKRRRRAEDLIRALTRLAGDVGISELTEARRAMLSVTDWPKVLREVAGSRWPELERRVRELVQRHLERVDQEPGAYLAAMASSDKVPRWIDAGDELADLLFRAFAQGYPGLRFALDLVERAGTPAGKAAAWGLASEAAFAVESDDPKAHGAVVERARVLAERCDDEAFGHSASDIAWLARELRDVSPADQEAAQSFVLTLAERVERLRASPTASEQLRADLDGALDWLREEPETSEDAAQAPHVPA